MGMALSGLTSGRILASDGNLVPLERGGLPPLSGGGHLLGGYTPNIGFGFNAMFYSHELGIVTR